MILVDNWLLQSRAEWNRGHMSQGMFYERLATELFDHTFERPFLRASRYNENTPNGQPTASSNCLSNGIGTSDTNSS